MKPPLKTENLNYSSTVMEKSHLKEVLHVDQTIKNQPFLWLVCVDIFFLFFSVFINLSRINPCVSLSKLSLVSYFVNGHFFGKPDVTFLASTRNPPILPLVCLLPHRIPDQVRDDTGGGEMTPKKVKSQNAKLM